MISLSVLWSASICLFLICFFGLPKGLDLQSLDVFDSLRVFPVAPPVTRGDSAFWDEDERVLYYVDTAGPAIYRFDPATLRQTYLPLDTQVRFFLPIKNQRNKFLISFDKDILVLTWNHNTGNFDLCLLLTLELYIPGNSVGYGIADPLGRVIITSKGAEDGLNQLSPGLAKLYIIDTREKYPRPQVLLNAVSQGNGQVFNLNNTIFYFIDTPTRRISAFDYNLAEGTISNCRTVFKQGSLKGSMNEMAIDNLGNLWVAVSGGDPGGMVIQVDPNSARVLQKIQIPTYRLSSLAFGGYRREQLYVPTQLSNTNVTIMTQFPQAGSLFRVDGTFARGLSQYKAVVNSPKCIKS